MFEPRLTAFQRTAISALGDALGDHRALADEGDSKAYRTDA
jgi:hypothetical protein